MSSPTSVFSSIKFLEALHNVLPSLYNKFGWESNKTTKLRVIIDQVITKCETIIKEGNEEYLTFLKKRMIK